MQNTITYPKISIITATYNRADFLEQTILSIINQNYPNLEYIIIDGGSTDGTLEIIKKYKQYINYWVSEKDNGMYDAIQKGFDHATGDILGWLNSDDLYFEWTFSTVAKLFTKFSDVEWISSNQLINIDENSNALKASEIDGYSRAGYLKGEHLPSSKSKFKLEYVMQESTFWRRSLWEKAGAKLDLSLKYAGDADLWFRFFNHAILYDVSVPLAKFRVHGNQITGDLRQKYEDEVDILLERYGDKPHNIFTATLRKLARKYTPFKLRRVLYYLGLLYPCYRLQYSFSKKDWEIKKNYY